MKKILLFNCHSIHTYLLKYVLILFVGIFVISINDISFIPAQVANAEIPKNLTPLKAQISIDLKKIPAGANTGIRIQLDLDEEFHAYEERFKIEIENSKGLLLTKPNISPVVEFYDNVSKSNKKGVHKSAILTSVVGVPSEFPVGITKNKLILTYQACTATYCLLPKKIELPMELEVLPSYSQLPSTNYDDQELSKLVKNKGWLFVLFTVFLGGILTSFTPCIFPMIPITLAVIGAQGSNLSRIRRLSLTLTYVIGMATTYSILGVIAALSGSLFGSYLGHPIVAWSFVLLFFVFSLSAFGLFDIQPPSWVRNKLSSIHTEGNFWGAFISGLIAGVLAGPCVGPVLVSILAFVAKENNPSLGFALMFVFAFGMGQLFLVLGSFTELIHKIPKSGSWLNLTKFIFGSALIGLSLYYLKPLVSPSTFLILLGSGVAFSIIIGHRPSLLSNKISRKYIFFIYFFAIVLGSYIAYPGLQNRILKNQGLLVDTKQLPPNWINYSEALLVDAEKNQKPMIIDFYADWCPSCIQLEKQTFSNPQVIEATQGVLLLRYDATEINEEFKYLAEKFKILGLPTVVFFDGKSWRSDLTLTGFEDATQFIERVKACTQ